VLPAEGGTVATADGAVRVDIPAGALPASGTPITITLTPVASPPPAPGLVPGTAIDLGPSGTQFSQPVPVKIAYNPASLPVGTLERHLRLFTLVGNAWQLVRPSSVDLVAHTVTGAVSHFSEYAVMGLPPRFQTLLFNEVPVTGGFTLVWGKYITAMIPWNASAGQIQTTVRAIPGLEQVVVTGSLASQWVTFEINGDTYVGDFYSGAPSIDQCAANVYLNSMEGVDVSPDYFGTNHCTASLDDYTLAGANNALVRMVSNAFKSGIAASGANLSAGIPIGQDVQLEIVGADSTSLWGNPRAISGVQVTWLGVFDQQGGTSTPSIATLSSSGLLHTVGSGSAWISAVVGLPATTRTGGDTLWTQVRVDPPPP